MEINYLSGAEFKTLFIRMLKELGEDLNSIKKIQSEMKDTLNEKRTILGETTVEWMKPRIKSMIWNIRKKKTSHHNNKKKKIIQKNENRLRSLWDNFKHTNVRILGVPEEEEKEQEIENLFEKIMKENSPNWVKEIDLQVQEAQRIPNKMNPTETLQDRKD